MSTNAQWCNSPSHGDDSPHDDAVNTVAEEYATVMQRV